MGWQYKKYSTSRELAQFEQQARSKKIGLWIDPNPVYPSEWRKAKKRNSKLPNTDKKQYR